MDAIDAYLDELAGALRGPRHRKADLLQEAHDSLVDATEAEVAAGASFEVAMAAAVADFGAVAEVARGYQEELDVAQARRASWMLCVVILFQPLVWDTLWPLFFEASGTPPSGLYELTAVVVQWAGTAALAVGILGVVATSLGLRLPAVRSRVVPMTAALVLCLAAVVSLGGLLMTITSPDTALVLDLPWLTAFVLLPMLVVARSAGRCLAKRADVATRSPDRAAALRR